VFFLLKVFVEILLKVFFSYRGFAALFLDFDAFLDFLESVGVETEPIDIEFNPFILARSC